MSNTPDEVSVSEAAKLLDCSRTWIFRLINDNELKARKIGNYYAITRSSVEAYQRAKEAK